MALAAPADRGLQFDPDEPARAGLQARCRVVRGVVAHSIACGSTQ